MNEFKKGMIVQLKSGGPKMTVVKIDPKFEGSIGCEWFSGSKCESSSFIPESLKIIKEEQKK